MSSHGTNTSGHGQVSLRAEMKERTGKNTARCYQCGKCSAGCPMAGETSLRPHDVMRLVNLDQRERLLTNESIWLCLTCETCTERCPNGCDPARTMDALREMAVAASPGSAPRAVLAFHRSFLDQIRLTGRSFELGLVAEYKLRTGALLQDVATVPGLVARGKLGFVPHPIDGVKEVRRIFEACGEATRVAARGKEGA
jgi:heterodisulfide reductase subunit C2